MLGSHQYLAVISIWDSSPRCSSSEPHALPQIPFFFESISPLFISRSHLCLTISEMQTHRGIGTRSRFKTFTPFFSDKTFDETQSHHPSFLENEAVYILHLQNTSFLVAKTLIRGELILKMLDIHQTINVLIGPVDLRMYLTPRGCLILDMCGDTRP